MKKITVGNSDIQYGKMWNDEQCPIALAIKRELTPCLFRVSVGRRRIVISRRGKRPGGSCYYKVPEKAREFIWNFDHLGSRYVKPFSFFLENKGKK